MWWDRLKVQNLQKNHRGRWPPRFLGFGEGAHDDGSGIVQSLEVAYLFKKNNIKPKNTIRIVFFMNEKMALEVLRNMLGLPK